MNWQDKGFLLSSNKYNENSSIVEFFTKDHGKISGILFGSTSKKIKSYLLIGNKFHLNYSSKNENSTGSFKVEIDKVNTALHLENKLKLSCIIYSIQIIKILTVENQGQPVELMDVFGGLGQLEDNFNGPEIFYPKIDKLVDKLLQKSKGVHAKAGYHDVVLDADLAGILAHEAIGHTTEADLVMGGSVAGDYLNQSVASELVTLIDYANSVNDNVCPVPVYVDDEGTTANDVTIIENGILKSFMHNKDSANELKMKVTGNARAYKYSDEPLIRMRNTAIKPGNDKLNDMIASIDDGYYLTRSSNGQADSTSEFMFGVVMGYEIKNGKIKQAIKDTTISGIAFDVLKTITMISDEMVWSSGGMCGKKQIIPVGMGGPAIKCKLNIGGR